MTKVELQSVRDERGALQLKVSSLETDNAMLRGELDNIRQNNSSSPQTTSETLRAELERQSSEEVARAREELSTQHRKEVQELRDTITELKGSQGAKEKEVEDLRVQLDKCSSLEEQLKSLSDQLQQEQGSKKVAIHLTLTLVDWLDVTTWVD